MIQVKRLGIIVLSGLLLAVITIVPLVAQDAAEENVLLQVYEGYLNGWTSDVDALPEYLSADVVRHHLRGPVMEFGELVEQSGIDEITADAAGFQVAFPGVEFPIDGSIERNDYLWVSFSTNELLGTDGVVIEGILLARYEDGKIAEIWVANDELAMLTLLDALPTPAEA